MIWNHDQDEPLMTRRRFFFLAGMAGAFAVAQQTGLVALAENAGVVVIPKRVIYGQINIGDVLAEIYAPLIREQINRNSELLKLLGGQNAVEIARREHRVPLATVPNTNRRRTARG